MLHHPQMSLQRPAHQRVHGAAHLLYVADAQGRTRLADLYQRAPCRVLFPDVATGEPPQAVLLTTSGGLTSGDRLRIEVEVREGGTLSLSTQAAEKLYRAAQHGEPARIEVRLKVGNQAWLEWLAQETILFEGSRLRRVFVADLEPRGRLLAVESLVFGRAAMGEDLRTGYVHDALRIRRGGRLLWADALHLQGDIAAQRARPFGLGGVRGCATIVYAGEDAERLLAPLRERLRPYAALGDATAFDGLLILRLLADDAAQLRAGVVHAAGALRSLAAGLPERLPRVWYC